MSIDKEKCEHKNTKDDKFERELGEYYFDIFVEVCQDCGKILRLEEF